MSPMIVFMLFMMQIIAQHKLGCAHKQGPLAEQTNNTNYRHLRKKSSQDHIDFHRNTEAHSYHNRNCEGNNALSHKSGTKSGINIDVHNSEVVSLK